VFSRIEQAPESDDFQLRRTAVPDDFHDHVEQVVLADRLREVVALVGFTRVAPPDEVDIVEGLPRAPLSRQPPGGSLAQKCGEKVSSSACRRSALQAGNKKLRTIPRSRSLRRRFAAGGRWGLDPEEGGQELATRFSTHSPTFSSGSSLSNVATELRASESGSTLGAGRSRWRHLALHRSVGQ
jgi:hypothetical protein